MLNSENANSHWVRACVSVCTVLSLQTHSFLKICECLLVVGKEEKTETSEVRFPRQPLKTSLSGAAAGQPGGHRVHTTLETPVLRHLWTSGTLRACRGTLCLSLSAAPAPSWVSAGRLPFAGRRRGSRSRTICPHQNACLPRASSPVWGEERSEQTQRVEATSAEPPPLPAGAV